MRRMSRASMRATPATMKRLGAASLAEKTMLVLRTSVLRFSSRVTRSEALSARRAA